MTHLKARNNSPDYSSFELGSGGNAKLMAAQAERGAAKVWAAIPCNNLTNLVFGARPSGHGGEHYLNGVAPGRPSRPLPTARHVRSGLHRLFRPSFPSLDCINSCGGNIISFGNFPHGQLMHNNQLPDLFHLLFRKLSISSVTLPWMRLNEEMIGVDAPHIVARLAHHVPVRDWAIERLIREPMCPVALTLKM